MHRRSFVVVAAAACFVSAAHAQEQVIASLPFLGGQTAGPTATDYEPPQDPLDKWVIEDFSIALPARLTRFEARGWVHPQPLFVFDVTVRVYRGWPPTGELLYTSTPGEGSVFPFAGWGMFETDFAGQFLPAGDYHVVWSIATRTSVNQVPILWTVAGPHAVGGGEPDNAWLWNPNGGQGWPDNLKKVPVDLFGNGQTGVNFALYGTPVTCYPDCNGDGALNLADFGCFQSKFALGDPYADCNGDGVLNLADFGCFQTGFAVGCP